MTSEAPRRAPFLSLQELVQRYRGLVHAFGDPVAISQFGFSIEEADRLFSDLDEDYHISRFFNFTEESGAQRHSINGFPATHVAIDPEIESIL
ncbi:MAG: hypothetical protein JSS69_15725 [Acidobacteria bacterium]|nr:hypothetical protein [Acidobacteriota bacterium]MBS1867363.1 hypothetical protein [Acidobacteriota bacterium]